jgi:hypothetical protein
VSAAKLLGDVAQPVGELDLADAGHEQAKGDGLGVAVGELLVGGVGEQQLPPVVGEVGEAGVALGELLGDLIAQQLAEARADFGQLERVVGRDGRPPEEGPDEGEEGGGRGEQVARAGDVALELDGVADGVAVAPEGELVAVGVEEVGEGLELVPLGLVVLVLEAPRVSALARGLELDVADEGGGECDGVVGPRLEGGDGGFPDEGEAIEVAEGGGEVRKELFEGSAELVLGLALGGEVVELGLGQGSKRRDGGVGAWVAHGGSWRKAGWVSRMDWTSTKRGSSGGSEADCSRASSRSVGRPNSLKNSVSSSLGKSGPPPRGCRREPPPRGCRRDPPPQAGEGWGIHPFASHG